MAINFYKILEGLKLPSKSVAASSDLGDIEVLSTTNKLYFHNGSSSSPIVTEDHSATLTNKTVVGAILSLNDTASAFNLSLTSTSGPVLTADRSLIIDVNNADRTLDLAGNVSIAGLTITGGDLALTLSANSSLTLPTTGTVATLAGAEIFTNKDVDGGVASNSHRITIPQDTKTNLDALTRKSGTLVYANDESHLYIDDGTTLLPVGGNYTTYTSESISAGGTVSVDTVIGLQYRRIQGNAAAVSAAAVPFGAGTPADGTVVRLVGMHDDNTVSFSNNDSSKGMLLNGSATLAKGDILTVQYDSVLDRYLEVSRNF